MRIGIIIDGDAEVLALQHLVNLIPTENHVILKPIYADMQPRATPAQIARTALSKINLLTSRGAEYIIVLMDREDNPACVPNLATALIRAFHNFGYAIEVVIKDCCYENWLIADPEAFRAMPGRFVVTNSFERAVRPNRADRVVKPHRLINRVARGREYHKRRDAIALSTRLNIEEVGRNSRSFRRFLHLLGHPAYSSQSKIPANPDYS